MIDAHANRFGSARTCGQTAKRKKAPTNQANCDTWDGAGGMFDGQKKLGKP